MKTAFGTVLAALAFGITGVAAQAQTGMVVGELSKGLSNPSAGPTPVTKAAEETPAAAEDNGALPGDSHVRIVRLSDAKGQLALDRKTGNGFEATMQNMPIVQGEKLKTADGYAEVEFEDNSALRLAPNSQVDFPLLALRSSGAKASTMKVVAGTVYVNTESTKGNEFMLETGDAKMMVAPSTHLRVERNETRTVVSVFSGSVEVQRGAETTVVAKKESLTLGGDQVAVAKKIEGQPFDAWDKESIDYHQRYANANTFAGGGNAFGLSDLNYYGSFINGGAFGSFWQPYLAGAGWSPYGNGLWALYPGAGYSWVSPYPWGWLPYHSGAWSFFPGYGWGWQPGGAWNGLNNMTGGGFAPTGVNGVGAVTAGGVHQPLRPAAPTAATSGTVRPSLVLSNEKPMVFSKESTPGNFVFQKDSAGLGVPRGSLGNLNKISNEVGRHGSASMEVYAESHGGMSGNSVHGATRGPETLRPASDRGWGGERGSGEASSAMRQGATQGMNPGSTGAAAPSFHGASQAGGGAPASAPAGGGSSSGGGSHGSVASPK
jgi:FecR protein